MCPSSWQSLQKSVDLTVPLYKWDKSYLQEVYLSSLKMSTMVRNIHVAMPTNSTSTQMSGNSDNLLGSFGFDATQMPSMQQTNLPLHNTEVSLLDLGSPTEKNGLFIFSLMLHVMFTLILHVMFTLMFTCTADAKLINVNSTTIKASSPQPSLWMDPQLCEVDMTPGRKPSLPVAMAPSPQQHRLSSSAQTILNCLPDLSFMLVIELIAV